MCGIAGKLWTGRRPDPDAAIRLLGEMNAAQAHRGPDADGVWYDDGIGLGHRRLSILDLDPRSNQPMASDDGRYRITFNGEIYNYHELRGPLEAKRPFRTESDTEVLLRAFAAAGADEAGRVLDSLRGMFAFAVWDRQLGSLLLARDPLGKKPLYYAETAEGLVFASTIRALLCDPSVPREPDEQALALYLHLGYIPAPLSAFAGIQKLEAGSFLLVDREGRTAIHRFWRPAFGPKLKLEEREIEAEILRRLESATRRRIVADVPVGAFLSGGLDSTAVVAMMQRASSRPVKTFCVTFPGSPLDEARQARKVADYLGCDHTELEAPIDPVSLPEVVRHCEEPFADPAVIPTYFMAQVARQHVTVVLNGDGGDENFAGYTPRHQAYQFSENLPWPGLVRAGLRGLAYALPELAPEAGLIYRIRKSLTVLGERGWRRNTALVGVFSAPLADRLMNGSADDTTASLDGLWQQARQAEGLDQDLYFNLALHLPERLLVKVDRATMAWALEARSPLLDRDVVDFSATIPAHYKLRGQSGKHIFKQALRAILPADLIDRPKQGFNPPLDVWLRGPLRPLVEETLLAGDSFVRRLVGDGLVDRIVRSHFDGSADHQRRLYTLLSLEVWQRLFIRQQAPW